MTFEHFTEGQLQEFANSAEIPPHAASHLQTCTRCNEQLQAYRLLFNEIINQSVPVFDFDVTEVVMQKLPQAEKKKMHIGISVIMFLIAGGMFAAIVWSFKDAFSLLFKNIGWLIPGLTFVSLATAAIALGYDMYSRYNKKINFINSLK